MGETVVQFRRLLQFNDDDLKEVFALFSSVSLHELEQVYDPAHNLFFQNENLGAEYELSQQRRDFAIDALRSVLYYLHRHGYELRKEEYADNLTWVHKELFVRSPSKA